jgi:hypothetical protein
MGTSTKLFKVFSDEDVYFLWSDKELTVDFVKGDIEEVFTPKYDTIYAIYPPRVRSMSDVQLVFVDDSVFDHEMFIAEVLAKDEKFQEYIREYFEVNRFVPDYYKQWAYALLKSDKWFKWDIKKVG